MCMNTIKWATGRSKVPIEMACSKVLIKGFLVILSRGEAMYGWGRLQCNTIKRLFVDKKSQFVINKLGFFTIMLNNTDFLTFPSNADNGLNRYKL